MSAVIPHDAIFDSEGLKRAIKECQDDVKGFGKTFDDALKRLQSETKELNKNLGDVAQVLKAFNVTKFGAADELKQINQQVNETIKKRNEAKQAEGAFKNAIEATKGTLAELSKLEEERQRTMAATGTVINDLNKAEAAAVMSAKEWAAAQRSATTATKEGATAAKSYVASQKEIALALVQDKLIFQQQQAAMRNQVREELAAKGSLEQRRAALIRLQTAYDNLGPEQRAAASGQRLQTILQGLTAQVKELELGTGRTSRNVGNYAADIEKAAASTGGFSGTVSKAWSAVRQLAYVLPGIGIAGIMNLAFDAVVKLLSKIDLFGTKLTETEKQAKNLKEAFSDINEASVKNSTGDILTLENLQKALNQTNLTQKERLDLVRTYNGIADEANKIDEKSVNNLNLINDKINTQIGLIKERGLARAAESIITQRSEDYLIALEKEKTNALEQLNAEAKAGLSVVQNKGGGSKANAYVSQIEKDGEAVRRALATDAVKTAKARLDAAVTAGAGLITPEGITTPTSSKASERQARQEEKVLEDSIRKREALIKTGAELQIKQQEIDQTNGLISEEQFQQAKLDIIKRAVAAQIAEESKLGGKADAAKILEFQKQQKDAELDFAKFKEKQRDDEYKENQKQAGRLLDVAKNEMAAEADAFKESQDNRNEARKKDLADELKAENARYEQLKAGHHTTFADEIQHLQNIKDIRIKFGEDTAEAELEIKKRTAEKQKEIDSEAARVFMQVGQEALSMVQNNLKAESDNRIAALETEKDRELTLAGNNAAAKEKIENDFNRRIAAEKTKQAKQEKEFAAFQIAINTAQAIARTLADVPKFDFGISTGILIAAYASLGAIQLAAVMSRPIPKFATGTDNAPQGPAIINEEGFELIERNGRLYVAKSQGPTLVNLLGGEKIYTHQESKKIIETGHRETAMSKDIAAGREVASVAAMRSALLSGGMNASVLEAAFRSAVKDIPVTENHWDERGYSEAQRRRNERVTYLNNRYK